jgi:plastocyanin domain-containing protein
VRAERERLGLRQSGPAKTATPDGRPAPVGQRQSSPDVQTAKVVVGDQGFEPDKLSFRAGVPARVTFTRTSDKTCGTEIGFPSMSIKRTLPLNEPVVIEFTPAKAGDVGFVCGMGMFKGIVVVR